MILSVEKSGVKLPHGAVDSRSSSKPINGIRNNQRMAKGHPDSGRVVQHEMGAGLTNC